MSSLLKEFESLFAKELCPLEEHEKIRPTRVAWRKYGVVSARVFPNLQRALDFAAGVKDLIVIQDAADPPPAQDPGRSVFTKKFARPLETSQWTPAQVVAYLQAHYTRRHKNDHSSAGKSRSAR